MNRAWQMSPNSEQIPHETVDGQEPLSPARRLDSTSGKAGRLSTVDEAQAYLLSQDRLIMFHMTFGAGLFCVRLVD